MSKKKPSRREQKERRRQETRRIREETGITPRSFGAIFDVDFSTADADLLQDVRAAFEPGQTGSPAAITELAMESQDLYAQPELNGLLANPMVAVLAYTRVAQEMEMDPAQIDDEKHIMIIRETTPLLMRVDQDLRTELITALFKLRRRRKRANRLFEAGRAALVQLLIECGEEASWRMLGLLHYISIRSVEEGFRMIREGEVPEITGEAVSGAADNVSEEEE